MAELAQQMMFLSEIVKITAQKSYMALKEVVNQNSWSKDSPNDNLFTTFDVNQMLFVDHVLRSMARSIFGVALLAYLHEVTSTLVLPLNTSKPLSLLSLIPFPIFHQRCCSFHQ
jgi:uncharacterized membrane protein YfhO